MTLDKAHRLHEPFPFPWITFIAVVVVILGVNFMTQPYEDSVSLVPPTTPYFIDPIWYLDDILGPSIFMTAGLTLLRRTGFRRDLWPVIGLGLSCMAFAMGDTIDAHWVLPKSADAGAEAMSFSSWMSKVMVVIVFCFFMIHSLDAFERVARRAMVFGFILLFIDQIQMSISLDFAGYSFHVFEESLEVATSLFFCVGVACRRIFPERLQPSADEKPPCL